MTQAKGKVNEKTEYTGGTRHAGADATQHPSLAAFLAVAGQLMLTVQVVALKGPMWAIFVAIVCIAAVQIFLWRGWSLYTTRAWEVVVRCGPRIDAFRIELNSASIRNFPPVRHSQTKT